MKVSQMRLKRGDAAEPVAQGEPDRIEEHDDGVAAAKSQQRIDARHVSMPPQAEWGNGVME